MSKMQNKIANRLKHLLVSLLVLAIFAFPMFLTFNWVTAVMGGGNNQGIVTQFADTRQTKELQVLQPDYQQINPFNEPLVTITFDDGWETIYANGATVLEKHNVRTTQYVLSGVFDKSAYMSVEQIQSLQNAGHDIASHTVSHADLTKLDSDEADYELKESKRVLEEKFGSMPDFATPLSAVDETVLAKIKQHYRSHRNTFSDGKSIDEYDVNMPQNFNRYNILAYSISQSTTLEIINQLLAYTVANNGWLVLNYHQVDTSNGQYAITPEVLDTHLQIIRSQPVKIPTMREVLDVLDGGTL